MSALGWELPLDAICTNGSNAQIVYFAKSRERPKTTVHVGLARCSAASPKQTLIRCCSIIEVVRSPQRTKRPDAHAAIADAAFPRSGGRFYAALRLASWKRPFKATISADSRPTFRRVMFELTQRGQRVHSLHLHKWLLWQHPLST
jgi:hypothetical protein